MNKNDFNTIFEFYKLSSKLTVTLRKGWVDYNLEVDRIESVAEHVYSTCMLGFAIYSMGETDIDLFKTMTMILLHEIDECLIGDITPVDPGYKLKVEKVRKSITKICNKLKNPKIMLSFFNEYEKGESKEAKFARQCDKLQSDFQAKLYEDKFNITKENNPLLSEEYQLLKTPEIDHKIHKLFIHNHESNYNGIFSELANFLKEE